MTSTMRCLGSPPCGAVHPTTEDGLVRVVANRLPVSWGASRGWQRAPGGLVTALDSLMQRRSLDWIGSSASLGRAAATPPRWDRGTLGVVDIGDDLAHRAIDGLANQVLWPALHGAEGLSRPRREWREWWEAYRSYNERFAHFVAARALRGDRIWFHDFHLFLAPAMLRQLRPDLHIGLSVHTPVDAAQLDALPWSDQLAEGLSGAHLVGVQRTSDAEGLGRVLRRAGSADRPRLLTSAVSVDPAILRATSNDSAVRALAARERDRCAGRTLVVGVDRLDHTKGIVERLEAVRLLLDDGRWDPGDVHVVQVAQPTRGAVPVYRAVRREVEALARRINEEHRRADGTAVVDLRVDTASRREVAALLVHADVAVVTPIRDGMNLVAKEFSVVNESHAGVLVLGRGAGAVDELGDGSIVVDGASPSSVADGLHAARLLAPERRASMAHRRAEAVERWTATDWSASFLSALSGSLPAR